MTAFVMNFYVTEDMGAFDRIYELETCVVNLPHGQAAVNWSNQARMALAHKYPNPVDPHEPLKFENVEVVYYTLNNFIWTNRTKAKELVPEGVDAPSKLFMYSPKESLMWLVWDDGRYAARDNSNNWHNFAKVKWSNANNHKYHQILEYDEIYDRWQEWKAAAKKD